MPNGAVPRLSKRALNRALLARQMLLKRVTMSAEAAIEHLVGPRRRACCRTTTMSCSATPNAAGSSMTTTAITSEKKTG